MQTELVIDHIVSWLKEYLVQSGQKGFVVGVSGGIDSAVTSVLAARTGYPVLGVEMPIHQQKNQVKRAHEHLGFLKQNYPNVNTESVDLTAVYDAFREQLPREEESEEDAMALINSRARLRMTTLYYFAGWKSYIVVGTGNKVEDFGVGFYTKYGDGGVDISPIADLLKTEVYELGKALGVADSIRNAPPTDGLWGDDRTDEDQIGASYPELEWAMEQRDNGHTADDFKGRQREVMTIYHRYHSANQHKMMPVPVCEIPLNLRK